MELCYLLEEQASDAWKDLVQGTLELQGREVRWLVRALCHA